MDREEPDSVASLFLCDGLTLPGPGRLLVRDEGKEPLDVGTAELLVRAGEPRELAEIGVAAAAVPPREHGEVVIVLGDDALAEALKTGGGGRAHEPVVALAEGFEEAAVARAELRRKLTLHPAEERALPGRPPQQVERVVRDSHERRGEHADERLVVVAVEDEAEIHRQVAHLLLPEVAASRRAVGRQ